MAILLMVSCNSNKTSSEENVVHENSVEPVPVNDFEITDITGKFEPVKNNRGAILKVLIKLKNNTLNTINNVEIISGIKAQYKNETNPVYYPRLYNDNQSDLEYLADPIVSAYGGLNNHRDKEKWLPGQTKSFDLTLSNTCWTPDFGLEEIAFPDFTFERTPDKVEFIAAYKFVGIDGEYANEIKIDMLDLWKEHQTQIGLR